jgi:starch-binding outer membrane protein, SusD/RagB family
MNKHNRIFKTIASAAAAALLLASTGCNKFLNVVPNDGLPSVETAFNLRSSAIRYLGTCYSYMTLNGAIASDPALLGSDELWDLYGRTTTNTSQRVSATMFNIARGNMTANTVYANDWASMYEGIRCCDILVDNIDRVPDMEEDEKKQWIAEVTFLKAYYHFNLVRKWGPVPIIRESLPIDSSVEEVRVHRAPIDECYDFILELLDQAMPDLPVVNPSVDEYGRANRAICASLKAMVAVYAASPLFNGNSEESALVDVDGTTRLFPDKTDEEKLARWTAAMNACKEAIDVCEEANITLYNGDDITYRMTDSLKTTLTLRNSFNKRWNSEVIWGNTQSPSATMNMYHRLCMPIFSDYTDMLGGYKFIGVPLKIAEQFYTVHGLPISNDAEWSNINPMDLRIGDEQHAYYICQGYTTIKLNFDREPRYYASLGFDGGTWLGQLGNYNDLQPEEVYYVACRMGGRHAKTGNQTGPVTGFFPKKHFPIQATWTGNNSFTGASTTWYPWPMIRLSGLYLYYAEAINEAEGPDGAHSEDLFKYLDAVRERAKIPDVKTAWDEYSNSPGYYSTKVGMRAIIHKERLNELAFEGQRFWDLRRWKEAATEYQKGIYGFDVTSSKPEDYYTKTFIYEQTFGLKDYLWPIPTSYIEVNPNLVQNIGW